MKRRPSPQRVRRYSARRLFWLKSAAAALFLAAACGKGGVVGGDCLDGFISCDGTCVDPFADSLHCGACNNPCDGGLVCNRGQCGEGGSSGAAGADASTGGSANGGSANGGSANGGSANGGSANGGSANGGSANGGAAGNSAMGGSGGVGTGGDGTGGGTGGDGTGGDGTGGGTGGDGTGGGTGGDGTGGAGTGGAPSGTGGVGGSVCLPPFDTPEACGDCDTQCSGTTPICAPAGGGTYECVRSCPEGLVKCAGQCVDLDTDPRNCGICGNVCPSGVCAGGICQGATAGHVVYICMNYAEVFQGSAQAVLLGNAVFLRRLDLVRVLAYDEHTPNAIKSATDRAIRWAGSALNREVEITRSQNLDTIENDLVLSNYDVFLVYDQPGAASGELADAGSQLATTLSAFTIGGGVVVILSGATGAAEMGEFATAAGLADIGTQTPYSSLAHVRANADAVGNNVVSPFQTLDSSCTFATSETPSSEVVFVVTDTAPGSGTGAPIVLHKVVTPP